MNIQGNHPLAELILRKLSGIEGVPPDTARTMVYRAASKAVEYVRYTQGKIAAEIDTWKASADDAGNCKVSLKCLEDWVRRLKT